MPSSAAQPGSASGHDCGLTFWFGVGHIIVLTGVGKDRVYFNDPDQGVKKEGTVKWFNEKLSSQLPGCLMVKDPGRY